MFHDNWKWTEFRSDPLPVPRRKIRTIGMNLFMGIMKCRFHFDWVIMSFVTLCVIADYVDQLGLIDYSCQVITYHIAIF